MNGNAALLGVLLILGMILPAIAIGALGPAVAWIMVPVDISYYVCLGFMAGPIMKRGDR